MQIINKKKKKDNFLKIAKAKDNVQDHTVLIIQITKKKSKTSFFIKCFHIPSYFKW